MLQTKFWIVALRSQVERQRASASRRNALASWTDLMESPSSLVVSHCATRHSRQNRIHIYTSPSPTNTIPVHQSASDVHTKAFPHLAKQLLFQPETASLRLNDTPRGRRPRRGTSIHSGYGRCAPQMSKPRRDRPRDRVGKARSPARLTAEARHVRQIRRRFPGGARATNIGPTSS